MKIGINDVFGESGPALELIQGMDWMHRASTRK